MILKPPSVQVFYLYALEAASIAKTSRGNGCASRPIDAIRLVLAVQAHGVCVRAWQPLRRLEQSEFVRRQPRMDPRLVG